MAIYISTVTNVYKVKVRRMGSTDVSDEDIFWERYDDPSVTLFEGYRQITEDFFDPQHVSYIPRHAIESIDIYEE